MSEDGPTVYRSSPFSFCHRYLRDHVDETGEAMEINLQRADPGHPANQLYDPSLLLRDTCCSVKHARVSVSLAVNPSLSILSSHSGSV